MAVIVEGPSDENAIGGILKKYFSSDEVAFTVVHGDITSDDKTNIDNALKKIDDLIQRLNTKYGYMWNDYKQIIHIADTDGTFTTGCVRKSDTETLQYFEDHIESSNIEAIEKRNCHKAAIMRKLYSTGRIHNVIYRIFLTHVTLSMFCITN